RLVADALADTRKVFHAERCSFDGRLRHGDGRIARQHDAPVDMLGPCALGMQVDLMLRLVSNRKVLDDGSSAEETADVEPPGRGVKLKAALGVGCGGGEVDGRNDRLAPVDAAGDLFGGGSMEVPVVILLN